MQEAEFKTEQSLHDGGISKQPPFKWATIVRRRVVDIICKGIPDDDLEEIAKMLGARIPPKWQGGLK